MCPQTRRGVGECHRAGHQYSGRLQWRRANGSHPCAILAKQFPRRRVLYAGSFLLGEPLSHRPSFFVSNHSAKPPWGDAVAPLSLCIPQSAFPKHQRDSPAYVLRTERQSSQSSLLPRLSPRPSGGVYVQADVYPLLFLFPHFSASTPEAYRCCVTVKLIGRRRGSRCEFKISLIWSLKEKKSKIPRSFPFSKGRLDHSAWLFNCSGKKDKYSRLWKWELVFQGFSSAAEIKDDEAALY